MSIFLLIDTHCALKTMLTKFNFRVTFTFLIYCRSNVNEDSDLVNLTPSISSAFFPRFRCVNLSQIIVS